MDIEKWLRKDLRAVVDQDLSGLLGDEQTGVFRVGDPHRTCQAGGDGSQRDDIGRGRDGKENQREQNLQDSAPAKGDLRRASVEPRYRGSRAWF